MQSHLFSILVWFTASSSSGSCSGSTLTLSSHWCPFVKGVSQFWQSSSLVFDSRGEEQSSGPLDSSELRRTSLCFIRMCCLSPFSEAATYSHWSHFSSLAAAELSLEIRVEDFCCFFARNSSLLLAFLRRVEGLDIFLVP